MMYTVLSAAVLFMLAIPGLGQLTEWTADNYPNPIKDYVQCGRYAESFICDPNGLLTAKEADYLEWMLRGIANLTKCPCSSHTCETKKTGYVIGVAIVRKLQIPNVENPTDNDKLSALRKFAFELESRKWGLGDCEEDIIIVYSADERAVYTFAGGTASKRLDEKVIDSITAERKHYFRGNKHVYAGLRSIILDYREALTDGGFVFSKQVDQSPKGTGNQVLSTMTSILTLFVCIFLLK